MPRLGDALSWRRLISTTPFLGDASSGQSVDFLPWTPRVVPLYVDFDLIVDFDFGQRPGTGRYSRLCSEAKEDLTGAHARGGGVPKEAATPTRGV